jgi:hypothetical protein
MAKVIFYPLGNANPCLIQTDSGKSFLFDFKARHFQARSAEPGDKPHSGLPLSGAPVAHRDMR